MIRSFEKEIDPFNLKKYRDEVNTEPWAYNCAGYAFRTFSWYEPAFCTVDVICDIFDDFQNADVDYVKRLIIKSFTKKFLRDFPKKLRVLQTINDLKADEELILFRLDYGIFYDDDENWLYNPNRIDFHFIVRRDDKWMEKQGSCDIEEVTYDPFAADWHICRHHYDSDIVILAMKI